jgi:hypothetical protein
MKTLAEIFEDHYQNWKSFIRNDAVFVSSLDEDYINNHHFQAIVDLGEAALPYIVEKLRTDEDAHFLIHAMEQITHKRFTPSEIAAAQASFGSPLGNQGFAAMWVDWWSKQSGKAESER